MELNQFLGGGGGLKISNMPNRFSALPAGLTGTLLTITPSANQYVVLTQLASSGIVTGISLTVGGRSIATGGVLQSNYNTTIGAPSLVVALEDAQSNVPTQIIGGKGEAFVLSKPSGTIEFQINYAYILMEDA